MPKKRANMPITPQPRPYDQAAGQAKRTSRRAYETGDGAIHRTAVLHHDRARAEAARSKMPSSTADQHREAAARHHRSTTLTRGQRAAAAAVHQDERAARVDPARVTERTATARRAAEQPRSAEQHQHAKPRSAAPAKSRAVQHHVVPQSQGSNAAHARGSSHRPAASPSKAPKKAQPVLTTARGSKYVLLPSGRKRYIK